MKVTLAAPAKVNLWLRVGPRQPSGYHDLDTLFCSLHLADSVILRPTNGRADLEVGHAPPLDRAPELGPEDRNLALRAGRLFMERAGLDRGPAIRLVKRVPVGAGLGGGSSDAAAVLRGLSRLFPQAPVGDLPTLGAALGSDVPFFVRGAPFAHATGRGERLAVVAPLPRRTMVLAVPDFPVATADAFRWLDQDRTDVPTVPGRPDALELDWDVVVERAVNDFEGPVFRRHPELAELKVDLGRHGARPALLAGSGSTVFGIFEDPGAADRAAAAMAASHPGVRFLVTRTRSR